MSAKDLRAAAASLEAIADELEERGQALLTDLGVLEDRGLIEFYEDPDGEKRVAVARR